MSDSDNSSSSVALSALADEPDFLPACVPQPRACGDTEARRTRRGRSFKPLTKQPVLTPERLVLVKELRTAYLQSELTLRKLVEDHLVHASKSQLSRLLNAEGRYPDRDTVLNLAAAVKAPQSKTWWTEAWSAGAKAEGWSESWIRDGKQGAKATEKKARAVNSTPVATPRLNQGKRGSGGEGAKLRLSAALATVIVLLMMASLVQGALGGDSDSRTSGRDKVSCSSEYRCSTYHPSPAWSDEVQTSAPTLPPDSSRDESRDYASKPGAVAPGDEYRLVPDLIERSRVSGYGVTWANGEVTLYGAYGEEVKVPSGTELGFECSTLSTNGRKMYVIPLYDGRQLFVTSLEVTVHREPVKCQAVNYGP
ncbi:hypothetical protein J8N05_46970 (plasmid) [Streptomyces sp. BH-SS-21]|uniref:Uncharacterized protein n=1 Tax=Streptomyces liliiviolaceus TaxID=2823109 RepID=A0A941BJ80_9ACTN|nr:hypothetical protein [Streptomyces liliiviolaceus]MBQ0855704.1 hypothetical protein [Streptomyces liliiviolaceus]